MPAARYLAIACIGYLLGAIPSGLVVARLAGGIDIRRTGSGRTGATNVMRAAGRPAGLATLLLDVSKASAAVLLAWVILPRDSAQTVGSLGAVAGHIWPVFIGFRGGRGVAAYLGCLLVLCWPVGVGAGALMLAIAGWTRYMSLGSIVGIAASFIAMLALMATGARAPVVLESPVPAWHVLFSGLAGGIILLQHRDNVQRLLARTERRLGRGAGPD